VGIPALFTEEFEVAIMIDRVIEEMQGNHLAATLKLPDREGARSPEARQTARAVVPTGTLNLRETQ
jgi:hypothetical protein